MNIKSVSGITCYVANLQLTEEFYTKLGFVAKRKDEHHIVLYINWFWIDCILISKEEKREFLKEAKSENKGAGVYINLSVDNVDDVYKNLLEMGLKPSSEPRDWPWGNREFVIRDPDGYKLVFFQKLG